MKERVTSHLRGLIEGGSIAIKNQFIEQTKKKKTKLKFSSLDPLQEEEEYSPVKGLVHKYECTALIKTSDRCAAHCRFCTRYRDIGSGRGDLSRGEIQNIVDYLKEHPEIYDVILSGGDPLFTPNTTFTLLELLEPIKSVQTLRVGTRLPIHAPENLNNVRVQEVLERMEKLSGFTSPVNILIHINHPDEITVGVERAIWMLRQKRFSLFSQTVFLNGVNYFPNAEHDVQTSIDILKALFQKLHRLGVYPYYIYRCDYVAGREHFIVPFKKELQIMYGLSKQNPGLAFPQHIVDAPGGRGKIRAPSLAWGGSIPRSFRDIDGKLIKI